MNCEINRKKGYFQIALGNNTKYNNELKKGTVEIRNADLPDSPVSLVTVQGKIQKMYSENYFSSFDFNFSSFDFKFSLEYRGGL